MTHKHLIAAVAVALVSVAGATRAEEGQKKQTYLIVSPHTAEQCLAALDHLVKAHQLKRFEFGCKHGDHTGYARVEASSAEEALSIVPEEERSRARALPLDHFTEAQVRALHDK